MNIDKSRRAFFTRAKKEITKTVIKKLDKKVSQQSSQWIRPPYAIDELEFRLACTRCTACVDACEYKVIFLLPEKYGAYVAGTPALDLVDNACRLCEGWPCVAACGDSALVRPSEVAVNGDPSVTEKAMVRVPNLARIVIDETRCLPFFGPECGACEGACRIDGALVFVDNKPQIDAEKCIGCALCRNICVQDPSAINIYSLYSQV